MSNSAVDWSKAVSTVKKMHPQGTPILKLPMIKELDLDKTRTATETMVNLHFGNIEPFTKERLKKLMIESGGWIPKEAKDVKRNMPMAERIALNKQSLADPETSNELDRLAQKLFEVSQIEKDHPDKMVFYHGTESKLGFLYDVIKKFRSRLEQNDPSGAWMRAFDDTFSSDKDIYEFLASYALKEVNEKNTQLVNLKDINNYHHGFSISGLSVNVSIHTTPH